MALAAGLGTGMFVCFIGWIIFIYLYYKNKTLIELLRQLKFKLSNENVTDSNEEINTDERPLVDVETASGARPKELTKMKKPNDFVRAGSGELETTVVVHRHKDVEAGSLDSQELYSIE